MVGAVLPAAAEPYSLKLQETPEGVQLLHAGDGRVLGMFTRPEVDVEETDDEAFTLQASDVKDNAARLVWTAGRGYELTVKMSVAQAPPRVDVEVTADGGTSGLREVYAYFPFTAEDPVDEPRGISFVIEHGEMAPLERAMPGEGITAFWGAKTYNRARWTTEMFIPAMAAETGSGWMVVGCPSDSALAFRLHRDARMEAARTFYFDESSTPPARYFIGWEERPRWDDIYRQWHLDLNGLSEAGKSPETSHDLGGPMLDDEGVLRGFVPVDLSKAGSAAEAAAALRSRAPEEPAPAARGMALRLPPAPEAAFAAALRGRELDAAALQAAQEVRQRGLLVQLVCPLPWSPLLEAADVVSCTCPGLPEMACKLMSHGRACVSSSANAPLSASTGVLTPGWVQMGPRGSENAWTAFGWHLAGSAITGGNDDLSHLRLEHPDGSVILSFRNTSDSPQRIPVQLHAAVDHAPAAPEYAVFRWDLPAGGTDAAGAAGGRFIARSITRTALAEGQLDITLSPGEVFFLGIMPETIADAASESFGLAAR